MTRSAVFQELLALEFNKYLALMYRFKKVFDLEILLVPMSLRGYLQLLLEHQANMESLKC